MSARPVQPAFTATHRPVGGVSGVTICTHSLTEVRRFYGEGLGMTSQGPWALDAKTYQSLAHHLGIPADFQWSLYTFTRDEVECAAHIRVIHLENRVTPFVHDTWSAMAIGRLP